MAEVIRGEVSTDPLSVTAARTSYNPWAPKEVVTSRCQLELAVMLPDNGIWVGMTAWFRNLSLRCPMISLAIPPVMSRMRSSHRPSAVPGVPMM
jgi:hypothetical protein